MKCLKSGTPGNGKKESLRESDGLAVNEIELDTANKKNGDSAVNQLEPEAAHEKIRQVVENYKMTNLLITRKGG